MMANTTLTVSVLGGTAPFSIKASLFKGSKFILGLTSPGSFQHEFKDLTGDHTIMISGPNPLGPNGKTSISLDTSNITLEPDSDTTPTTRKGKAYLVSFHFKA
jgi:hypothetical protein